jgi:hypothetical protein
MKHTKLIILGITLASLTLAAAQAPEPVPASPQERKLEIVRASEVSTKAIEQGAKFAAAADYLKLALVLGLGMLMGRMSAVSHRELTELKSSVARLASR